MRQYNQPFDFLPKYNVLLFTFAGLLIPSGLWCADYDFYMDFNGCKMLVGYLVPADRSLAVIRGDPTFMACKRHSNAIHCDFIFKADPDQQGQRGNSENYTVIADSPPILYFETDNGSSFVAINTSQHAVTLISRIVDRRFVGSQVCHGMYTTQFESQTFGHQ